MYFQLLFKEIFDIWLGKPHITGKSVFKYIFAAFANKQHLFWAQLHSPEVIWCFFVRTLWHQLCALYPHVSFFQCIRLTDEWMSFYPSVSPGHYIYQYAWKCTGKLILLFVQVFFCSFFFVNSKHVLYLFKTLKNGILYLSPLSTFTQDFMHILVGCPGFHSVLLP